MDTPKTIAVTDLVWWVIIGGAISFAVTTLGNVFVLNGPAYLAPITEEPAKLIAVLLLMKLYENNGKRLYGISGILIFLSYSLLEPFGSMVSITVAELIQMLILWNSLLYIMKKC